MGERFTTKVDEVCLNKYLAVYAPYMVEKSDTGRNADLLLKSGRGRPVEVYRTFNLCLVRITRDCCFARGHI